jgi:serine/threonine protein kinase
MTTSVAADPALNDLIDELTARLQAGETVDFDAVIAQHPDHADTLRRLLPALQVLADLSRSVDEPQRPLDGETGTLGDFRLIREVGRGGMGIVYEAEQISLDRSVALKILPFAATMDPRHLQRFHNEARAAACLHHANIVPVHGVGCERGVHYYAMQLIEGQTLAEVIKNLTPQPPSRSGKGEADLRPSPPASGGEGMGVRGVASTAPIAALTTKKDKRHFRHIAELIASAADALEYAHSMGVVHRDIKPGNLMLDHAGHLWITDFGLAKSLSPDVRGGGDITLTGDIIGTLRYMSPEQALAKHGLVDHRTDIYSLGATLYELLTLKPAVEGADKAEILKHIAWEEPIALRKHDKAIPAELETITLKSLAKEPGERYTTAGELAEDLRRWLGDRAIRARRPTLRQRYGRWVRRHPGVTAGLGLAAGLLLAGAWAWHREKINAETAALVVAAESDKLRDANRLLEGRQAARRALDLLPRLGGGTEIRRSIEERISDLTFLIQVEEVRLEQASAVRANVSAFDLARGGPLYRQAFLDYGVDILGNDESAVIAALRRRAIRSHLAAALDDWSRLPMEPGAPLRLVRIAETLDPDGTTAQLRRTGSDKQALKQLAKQIAADAPAQVLYRVAVGLAEAKAYDESEELVRAGLRRFPDDFWLYQHLGSLVIGDADDDVGGEGRDRAPEGLACCRAALALRPHSEGAWINVGYAYTSLKMYEEAEAAARRAIELNPDYAAAHHNLGVALNGMGRPKEAEIAFRRALELNANNASALASL